jgi:hypothetical protein
MRKLSAGAATGGAVLFLATVLAAPARGDEDDDALAPEQVVTGIERPAREEGDAARDFGNVMLFVPRELFDLLFRGTSAAAGLVADEQLVPRYKRAFGTLDGGAIYVFPTLFAETDNPLNVGARMIADTRYVSTSQRFGFGGPEELAFESRVLFKGGRDLPFAVSLEAFDEHEKEVEYHGLGIRPDIDDRNRFRPGTPYDFGLYREQHVRFLGSLGLRLADRFQFFLSASLARRRIFDATDAGDQQLTQVFEPATIALADNATWIGYAELAARFDSRAYIAKPSPGVLCEVYGGGARSVLGDPVTFMRVGGRVGAFLPVYRQSNIIAPRLVLDQVVPLGGLEVPFPELPGQPDFRGFDNRRDRLSIVLNLDYTWQLTSFMGMRLFFDQATVGPGLAHFSTEQIKFVRWAAGLGFDFYTDNAMLAQTALSASPDGVRFLLTVGAPEGYGDRQHRD